MSADWPGTLILGGGLAGSAAAILLARAGHRVRLWEKALHPHHKICGEFLSWEGQAVLARLGVDADALGAERIDRLRVTAGVRLAEAPLGFIARSLSRRVLDAALLAHAHAAGALVERGVTARALLPDGVVDGSHGALRPARLMLATGKHEVRGARRDGHGTINDQLGFKTYFRLRPAERELLSGHVELHLFEGGYAGLQMVEREAANLCFLVSPARWQAAGGDFAALLAAMGRDAPHLARRLEGALPLLDRPIAISGVPYGFVHQAAGGGFWRLGDQAAVIPSFTGDGMSLALVSAQMAAKSVLAGERPGDFQARLAAMARGPVRRAAFAQRMLGLVPARQQALVRALGLAPWAARLGVRATRVGARATRVGRAD